MKRLPYQQSKVSLPFRFSVVKNLSYPGNENKFKNQNKSIHKTKITCYLYRKKGHFGQECSPSLIKGHDNMEKWWYWYIKLQCIPQ